MNTMALGSTPAAIQPDQASWFLGSAPSPMAATQGRDHIVSYANPAFCSQIGKSSEQLIGKRLCDALPAMHDCTALLSRVCRSGNPERHTQQLFGHPSSVFWSFRVWPVVAHEHTEEVLRGAQGGVERMGGRVGVESVEQQGSRFWFELRKADAPA